MNQKESSLLYWVSLFCQQKYVFVFISEQSIVCLSWNVAFSIATAGRVHACMQPPLSKDETKRIQLTSFCWDEERGLRSQLWDDDVVVEDGLGVVGHSGQEVAVEHHLAIVEVETANLEECDKRKSVRFREPFYFL